MVGRPVGVLRTRRRTGRRGTVRWKEGEVDGDGYPRGKQFLLIQRSHPHGGASLVDSLLDLFPCRSVLLLSFLSRSRAISLFLAACANLAPANKCSSACHPRQSSVVPFFSRLSRRFARNAEASKSGVIDLVVVDVPDRSFLVYACGSQNAMMNAR